MAIQTKTHVRLEKGTISQRQANGEPVSGAEFVTGLRILF
jgi:hypothetical protein